MCFSVRQVFGILLFPLCFALQLRAEQAVVRQETGLLVSPESEGIILDILTAGMTVEVVSIQGDWVKVRMPATSEMGWAQKQDIVLESEKAAAGLPATVSGDMSGPELDKLRGRVKIINRDMRGIETRLDGLLERMKEQGYLPGAAPETAPVPGQPTTGMRTPPYRPAAEPEAFMESGAGYRWRNQFHMGKYIRGGQDFFGLALSRFIDRYGRIQVDGEVHYGVGDNRGKSDDFIEWNTGLAYNLWPERYRIYPYLWAHAGQRHQLGSRLTYLLVSPGIGINAELSGIFSLSADLGQVYLFRAGANSDDLRLSFNCSFNY